MLRIHLYIYSALLSILLCFGACSLSDDAGEGGSTGDCAITKIALGNMHRTVHTTLSDGRDSAYQVTISGSYYPLHIDQLNRTITNQSYLPTETHITKMIISSITTDGAISIQSLHSGNDTIVSTTDSLDFSVPRRLTSYSSNGASKRSYTMTLRMLEAPLEQFTWEQIADNDATVSSFLAQKAFIYQGRPLVFGYDGANYLRLAADGVSSPLNGITNVNIAGIQQVAGTFYALADNELYSSADGEVWIKSNAAPPVKELVGGSKERLYGIGDKQLYSTADGITWAAEALDDAAEKLPTAHIASLPFPSRINGNTEFVLLIGQAAAEATLWKKENDLTAIEDNLWSYYPDTEENPFYFPVLERPILFSYDRYQFAIGYTNGNLSPLYISKDAGRTWRTGDEVYLLPKTLGSPTSLAIAVTEDHFLYLFCGGTGEVWRGRLNRLALDNDTGIFQ